MSAANALDVAILDLVRRSAAATSELEALKAMDQAVTLMHHHPSHHCSRQRVMGHLFHAWMSLRAREERAEDELMQVFHCCRPQSTTRTFYDDHH